MNFEPAERRMYIFYTYTNSFDAIFLLSATHRRLDQVLLNALQMVKNSLIAKYFLSQFNFLSAQLCQWLLFHFLPPEKLF